jgi:gliding motility-associated-like protein
MRLYWFFLLSFLLFWGSVPAYAQFFDPVANNDSGVTNEDTEISFSLTANDTDGDLLGINPASVDLDPGTGGQQTELDNAQGHFEVSILGVLTYEPAPNFNGIVTFTYIVRDLVAVPSNEATVQITVNAVNDIPVITGQSSVTINENENFTINFGHLTVTDVESTYPTGFSILVSSGSNYTFSGTTITPNTDFSGPLTVSVQVNDGTDPSLPFNFTIAVNDKPLITGQDPLSTNEDQPITLKLNDLDVTDSDDVYPSGFALSVTDGDNYSVAGAVVTPDPNYSGTISVPVTVNDGMASSNVFNASITVTSVNDLPVINSQNAVSTNEDQSVLLSTANLNVTDIDHPSYPTGFVMNASSGANYTLTGLQLTPLANFSGTLTVPVTVTDPAGGISASFNLSVTVNSVNDAPVIGSQDPVSTQENTPIELNTGMLNVTDVDHPGYPTGFTMSASGGTSYTVSGLVITPNTNFSGTLTVPVQVQDPLGASSNSFNLTITVTNVNSPPVINSHVPLSTNEDQAITLNLNNLNVTDTDNPGYPTGFSMNLSSGSNYSFTGLVVTPAANFSGTLTVPVTVTDPDGATSSSFNISITVTAVNDAPVITGQDPLTTGEEQAITIVLDNLNVNDSDNTYPTGFTLTVQAGTNYTVNTHTVTPVVDFTGVLTVPVLVNDGTVNSNVFNLSINVADVNDLPVAVNDTEQTGEDTPVSFNVISNDTDGDGTIAANTVDLNTTSAGIQQSVSTASGTFSVNASGVVTFTPLANFSGAATVQYTVNDNSGGTSNAATITVTVNPANDAPVITGQNPLVTNEDQNIIIGFSDLVVTDVDNTYPTGFSILVQAGSNYTFTGTTITPAPNFSGSLTVPVRVSDGATQSAIFNVTITVNPINDAPLITTQDPLTTNEDQPILLKLADVDVTDSDDVYPSGFTMSIQSAGTNYTFSGLTVTPAANFSGLITVPVVVNDGTANSNVFNLQITVTAVNDAPVITAQSALSLTEDQSIVVGFSDLTVTDPDNTYPTGFTLTLQGGSNYSFVGTTVTPNPNFSGTLTVPVRVNDGNANSNVFNLSITVNPVNDPPVINSQVTLITNEDTPITVQFSNLNVTDTDNTYPTNFNLNVSGGSNYSVVGTTVTPSPDFSGVLTVPVVVNDGTNNSNTFNLSITVTAVNDAPQITAQQPLSVNEDQSITLLFGNLTVTDVDNSYPTGFTLTVLAGSNYTVAGNVVTPSANFSGTLTVPVRVNDGSTNSNTFNLSIVVNPGNDAPTITGQTALSVNEDTPVTIQLSNLIVNDPDNGYPTGFTLSVQGGTNYTVSGTTVTPNANFSGTLTVPVQVNDGTVNSNVFNMSVTVTAVNDAPVITGQAALSVNEDNALSIALGNLTVTDPDNTYPTGFTLTVLAGTNYSVAGTTITPSANFSGTLTVPVRVRDGNTDSAPFNLSVTVNPVNDAPVITGQQPLSTTEEQALTITLNNLLVTDPDNSYPTGFTLTVLSGSNYSVAGTTITPGNNFTGTLTVPVRVNDGSSNSNIFNLQVSVTGVNDAPNITGQLALSVNEDNSIAIQLSHLTVVDTDNSYPSGFSLTISPGANYTVSGNTVTPAANFNGVLSVPVTVNDGVDNSNSFNLQISVNPVNDAPQITGQTPLNTGEAQPITIQLSQLFVLDPDDTYPADFSLFVLSGSNYTLSGNVVTPAANFSGLLLVKVLVNDGTANSGIYDLQILVNSVNDPPVITGFTALSVNEDNSIALQLSNLTVTDPDNTFPTGFTLTVLPGSNYTFTGNTVTPALNFTGTLPVSVKVNDGLSDSAPFNIQITVNPVNDAPVITGQQPLATNEDQPITLQFANLLVVDPDNTYPTNFSIIIQTGTNYSFSGNVITPILNFTGTLTVPVRVFDGNANSAIFNLSIDVDPVNDAPSITGQKPLTTAEDTPFTLSLGDLTVVDPDDTYPTGFSLTVAPGTNYTAVGSIITPALNFNGLLSVNVTVNDGSTNSAVFPLQVTVSAVNTPPLITGQAVLTTNEDTPITVQLSHLTVVDPDDQYPNGFTLTLSSGSNYTISGNTVTPAANFSGNLTVPVRVNDGTNNSLPFNLSVKVNPVNDPPTITAQASLTINEDQFINLLMSHLTVSDPDNTYPTGFTMAIAAGSGYSVSGNRVTPNANFNGVLTVNVTVHDGADASPTFPLSVTVNPINDPPTANGLAASLIAEDHPNEVAINLLNGFSDPEDASNLLSYQIVSNDNPTFFESIGINQTLGELKYKVKPNVFGTAKITIRATDTGGLFVQDVLTITINGVNDAPSFSSVSDKDVNENSPQQTITLSNVTKGPFENTQTLNLFATSGNTTIIPNPVITYDGSSGQATLTYTIQPNKWGNVTITIFAIDDGSNTLPNRNSFSSSFKIEVIEINDQPTLDAISFGPIQEDAPVQNIPLTGISAGPGETQTITVTASASPNDMTEILEVIYTSPQNTGSLKLKPKADVNGTIQVTVTANDNGLTSPSPPHDHSISRTFNLVIQPVNDLPVFTSQPVPVATAAEPYVYDVKVSDVDHATITLTSLQKPAWATFTVTSGGKEGRLSGTPPASATGSSVVKIQAKDALGNPVVQEFTLVVNRPPVITPIELTTLEDEPLVFQQQKFTAAFTDADQNPIEKVRIESLPKPALGVLKFNGVDVVENAEIPFASVHELVYHPKQEIAGVDTILWNASDGYRYASNPSFIKITIIPANDEPVIDSLENDPTDPLDYHIGSGPQTLTDIFWASDADLDSLVSAVLGFRILNYDAELDELLFENTANITGEFNEETGTLALSGKAPATEYISFIRNVKYIYHGETLPLNRDKVVYFTLSDGNLLSATEDRYVRLRDEFVDPVLVTGFTPDLAGKNQTWLPIRENDISSEYRDAEVRVFDKRGRLVFETIGFEKRWDGTYQGEPLPADGYFFTVDLKLPFIKKTYKGVVTLLR